MAFIKDYIWTIPLTGGILLLISFFTPSAYATQMYVSEYHWMWGLFHVDVYGSSPETRLFLTEDPAEYMIPIFLSGFLSALMILIASIVLIISANSIRKGRKILKDFENTWLGLGIMIFIAAIIFIIGIDITFTNYIEKWMIPKMIDEGIIPPGDYDVPAYWDTYDPGFGIIAPFITGVLAIVGAATSKYVSKREVIPIKEKVLPTTESLMSREPKVLNYCPECGQKVTYKGGNYCSSCGFEFPH